MIGAARNVWIYVCNKVDNWRFWMFIAYLGLAGVVVALVFLYGRQAKDEARRAAEQQSSQVAQVSSCYQGVSSAGRLLAILDGIAVLEENAIKTTRSALKLTQTPELRAVRLKSLQRSRAALESTHVFQEQIDHMRPTLAKCRALARKLRVDPEPFLPGKTPTQAPAKSAASARPSKQLVGLRDLNCADMHGPLRTPAGDPDHLDADHDGIACEGGRS